MFIKRSFDLIFSIISLTIISPLLIIIGFCIKLSSPGDILYRGVRAGQYNKEFKILKFRTMVKNAEALGGGSTAYDDVRLTKIGRFLRDYKLDELPQLINVIRGEMSIVGPRPQLFYYTNKYSGDMELILSVRPGITDLASLYFINMDKTLGHGDVDYKYEKEIEPIKNQLRLKYVKEHCFTMDIRIIIETVFSLMGINNITKLNINS